MQIININSVMHELIIGLFIGLETEDENAKVMNIESSIARQYINKPRTLAPRFFVHIK